MSHLFPRRLKLGHATKTVLGLALAVGVLLSPGLLLQCNRRAEETAVQSFESVSGGGAGGRFRQIRQLPPEAAAEDSRSTRPRVRLRLWTGGGFTALSVDDVLLVNQSAPGLHLFILNQATASLMGHRIFADLPEAVEVLNSVVSGRIVAMATDTGRRIGGLNPGSAAGLTSLKVQLSRLLYNLQPGLSWALVSLAKIGRLAEKISASAGQPLVLEASVRLTGEDDIPCPGWPSGEETLRRRRFCGLVDGFSSNVCSCDSPARITFGESPTSPWASAEVVPITVMSGNRPQFLLRTLTSLLSADSVSTSQIRVLLRGFFDEPRLVCDLLRVSSSQRRPASGSLADLYRLGLAETFQLFPSAKAVILLEDGVSLSRDIVQFFNWTLRLMDRDPSLFCVSAWNDQSLPHTSRSPEIVHRVQRVPLKALALRRSVWDAELSQQWPEARNVDLSNWLNRVMGSRRYCLRPALSRAVRLDAPNDYLQLLVSAAQLRDSWTTAAAAGRSGHAKLPVASDEGRAGSDSHPLWDETAYWQYDSQLQQLIARSLPLGPRFSRGCQYALKFVEDVLAAASGNETLPVFLLTVSASETEAADLQWKRIADCFSLGSSLSCLYKGICRIDFANFLLLLGFRDAGLHFRFA